MVKTKGPTISAEASGQLAKTLIFVKGMKARAVKKHATPRNPKSPAQVSVRAMIKFLSQDWQTLTTLQKATWNTPAFVDKIAPYHAYLRTNMIRWKTFRGPGKTYPVAPSGPTGATIYQDVFDGVASTVERVINGGGILPWGYIIFRSPVDWPAGTLDQVIAVVPRNPVLWTFHRDTPLEPGTYWYRTSNFTEAGQIRAMGGSDSGTAT